MFDLQNNKSITPRIRHISAQLEQLAGLMNQIWCGESSIADLLGRKGISLICSIGLISSKHAPLDAGIRLIPFAPWHPLHAACQTGTAFIFLDITWSKYRKHNGTKVGQDLGEHPENARWCKTAHGDNSNTQHFPPARDGYLSKLGSV